MFESNIQLNLILFIITTIVIITRRNAETYELRPKSANPEHSSVHPNHPHEPGFLSGGRGENESNAEEMGETQDADVDEGSRTSSAGAKATTFLELSASPNTHKFAR